MEGANVNKHNRAQGKINRSLFLPLAGKLLPQDGQSYEEGGGQADWWVQGQQAIQIGDFSCRLSGNPATCSRQPAMLCLSRS